MMGGPPMMVDGPQNNNGLEVLLANDEDFFGQEFQNPLHPDNNASGGGGGGAPDQVHNQPGGGNGGGNRWSDQPDPEPELELDSKSNSPRSNKINMDDVHTDPATGALYTLDEHTGETKWLDDDDASSFFTESDGFQAGENPMDVLLDNDQDMFGQEFANPLHANNARGGGGGGTSIDDYAEEGNFQEERW